ncbi:sugar kinase [Christiangramia fulva]|uniref:Sugar kinase n=1 Tax=Christiangramia fulva TaxID=2126553 RepID=A0A2R3Z4E1_9FLAO|nr:ROK family protein [Christiangramia fulva]AVR45129.1 sugar kinase [Christiangramia fulva]
MKDIIVGVDIGATKMHIGAIKDSKIFKDLVIATSANAPEKQIIDELIEGIESLCGHDFVGIGIGVPGLIDEEQGIVYDLWNIPSWKEVYLKDSLEKHFKKPVRITNDANTFALGEKKYGQGKTYKNFVGVSLGTGYGTGIIINHELYSGTLSGAGELANIPYLDRTIEDYCSGKFFKLQYQREGAEVFEKAEQGDPEALKIFDEFGKHLAESLKLILYILSPEAIILGGSISRSFKYFEKSLMETINTFPFKRILKRVKIFPSAMPDVSVLGSAAMLDK